MRLTTTIFLLCATTAPTLAQDVSAVKDASQKFTSAMSGGDGTLAATMFSDDAYVLPPGRQELRGREEIQRFLNGMARGVQNLQYTSEDVRPIGDSAAREMGTFSFKMRGRQGGGNGRSGGQTGGSQGGGQEVTGKYLIVWEKSGGDWKIVADMWNRNGNGGGGGGQMRRGGTGGGNGTNDVE